MAIAGKVEPLGSEWKSTCDLCESEGRRWSSVPGTQDGAFRELHGHLKVHILTLGTGAVLREDERHGR